MKVRVVESIEKFGSKLQPMSLCDREQFRERNIEIGECGTVQDIPARVTEGICNWLGKCTRIEPFVRCALGGRQGCGSPNVLCMHRSPGAIGRISIRQDCERKAILQSEHPASLPSLHDLSSKRMVRVEGNLVYVGCREPIANILFAASLLRGQVQ